MPTRVIDFVRHGQYDGVSGALTPLGVAQLEILAARYKAAGTVTHVQMSPVPRATESGRILGRVLGLKPRTNPDVFECLPSLRDPLPPVLRDVDLSKVSEHKAMLDGVVERLCKVARGADKHVVVACHGNVTRYCWLRAMGLDDTKWWDLKILHASLSRVVVEPTGRVRGVCFGDVGHLPPALQTET